jgi:hypothetical protein
MTNDLQVKKICYPTIRPSKVSSHRKSGFLYYHDLMHDSIFKLFPMQSLLIRTSDFCESHPCHLGVIAQRSNCVVQRTDFRQSVWLSGLSACSDLAVFGYCRLPPIHLFARMPSLVLVQLDFPIRLFKFPCSSNFPMIIQIRCFSPSRVSFRSDRNKIYFWEVIFLLSLPRSAELHNANGLELCPRTGSWNGNWSGWLSAQSK